MNYLEKIQTVRENILLWSTKNGSNFHYPISGFCTENEITNETTTTVTKEEQREIVRYLARRKYLDILNETSGGGSFHIKILPKTNPTIKLKTLELMARELKDYYTGTEIVSLLKQCGVDERFIIYPNSKWSIFYMIFEELSISNDKKAKELLFNIITEAVHPLNLGGNKEKSDFLVEKFRDFLKYDGFTMFYLDDDKKYVICPEKFFEIDEQEATEAFNQELFQQEQEELEFLRKPENKEKISTLRKAYQVFMNIVEVFCENPSKPNQELNDAYVSTKKLVSNIVNNLNLQNGILVDGYSRILTLQHYSIPFNNLFTAEAEYKDRNLHWDELRPKMHATYGSIDDLYQRVDASDILSKPDIQQTLNNISLLLSKTKEENKKRTAVKQKEIATQIPVQKIEIIAMPELQIKNTDDSTITKNKKKIALPKFTPTTWSKVQIRFIDETNVYIIADKKAVTADYEGLGFRNDKNGKPNTAWKFLFELARNNGETQVIPSPIPDAIKNQKRVLSDRLKTIFKNDTDPFDDFPQSKTYKIKIKLIPPTQEPDKDKYGINDYLDETMTSQYEAGK